MRLIYTSLFLVLSVLVLSGVFFGTAHAHSGEVFHDAIEKENVEVAQNTEGGRVDLDQVLDMSTRIEGTGNRNIQTNDESKILTGRPVCVGRQNDKKCFFLPYPSGSWGWESYRNNLPEKRNTSWQHFALDIYEGGKGRAHSNPGNPTGEKVPHNNPYYYNQYDTGIFALYDGTIQRVVTKNNPCGGQVNIQYNNVDINRDGQSTTTIQQRICHVQPKVHTNQDGSLINADNINYNAEYKFVELTQALEVGDSVRAGDLIGYVGGSGYSEINDPSNPSFNQSHLHTDFYNLNDSTSNNCLKRGVGACPQIPDPNYPYHGLYQLREGDILYLDAIQLGGMKEHRWFINRFCSGDVFNCHRKNNHNCTKVWAGANNVDGYDSVNTIVERCSSGSVSPPPPFGGITDPGEQDPQPPGERDPVPPGEQIPPDLRPPPPSYDSYLDEVPGVDMSLYDFTVIPGDPPELNRGTFDLNLEVDWPSIPGIGTLNTLVSDGLSLNELIVFVYTLLLWLSIILAFLALIYAGFLYIVSGANPGARSKAFDYVKRIAFGGTILLLTVLILSFINTDLVAPQRGIGGYVSDAEIKALNDVMCRVEEDQLQINACVAPLPEQLRDSFSDYNYIGNNYAFIDYNKTLITNLSNNFVGTETEVFGEQGGLNLKHGQMTLKDAVNENTLIQRIDELREGGQYDIRKCETHESTLAALNELRNRLTTKHSANSREYSNAGGDQYSSFAIDLYKLVFNTYFFSESDGDADLSNNNNVNSIEYQLGELWRLNRFDTKERANYLTNKMFGNNTDEDSYLYTGLLTLAQAQEQAGENGLAGVNPMRVDVYRNLGGYSALQRNLDGKRDELNVAFEALDQDPTVGRNDVNECSTPLCLRIKRLQSEFGNLQNQINEVNSLQNPQPRTYSHAEDFFFTIESTLDINNPGNRLGESQRLWLWVHIPATEIRDILESIAGAADPEEKCGVSKKACNEGKCTDQQGNNQSECVYGIVENTLKNALPNNCSPTPEAGEEVSGQDALKKLGELRMLEDFKRMRNELSLQITRIEHANQFRSELDALHTCDSLRVYFERLKKLQNSKQEGVYDDGDGQCKTDRLAVGGFQVDVDNDNDNQVLTYEQQLEYLVCCPSEDEGRNQSIQEITESCGGVNVVLCSLPVPTTSSE